MQCLLGIDGVSQIGRAVVLRRRRDGISFWWWMSGKRRSYGGTGVRSFLFERPPARHVGMPKAFPSSPNPIQPTFQGS